MIILNIDLVSILFISSTPFTLIIYALLSMSNCLTPKDAKQVEEGWKRGINQGELHSDDPAFQPILSIIFNRTGKQIPAGIEYLAPIEGAYGGTGVYAYFGDERDTERLAPLTLTDKWVVDYIQARENDVKVWFYRVALTFLIIGLFLEILRRAQVV